MYPGDTVYCYYYSISYMQCVYYISNYEYHFTSKFWLFLVKITLRYDFG